MTHGDSEIFGVLRSARRVWAVAAIHGEAARLTALHRELIGRFATGDRLVYLGNYLGVGGDIAATLDELLLFRREIFCTPGLEPEDVVFLRGAQEEMWRKLLQLQFAATPRQVFDWMLAQGAEATLRAYGGDPDTARSRFREGVLAITKWTGLLREAVRAHPGHEELLTALRRAAYTEGGELLFVSAGVDPGLPLSDQADTFWWGNSAFSDMTEPFAGFHLVVRGYDRHRRGADIRPPIASIDSGAGFGGRLSAACFDLEGHLLDWIDA